jgi:hypothetical protein
MAEGEGISPVEYFVLHESDGHCQLWELTAAWTGNGPDDDRRTAMPLLRDAVVGLSLRGLVDVYDLVRWPGDLDDVVPIPPRDVAAAIANVQHWLWRGESTSLITVSLADAGIPYL